MQETGATTSYMTGHYDRIEKHEQLNFQINIPAGDLGRPGFDRVLKHELQGLRFKVIQRLYDQIQNGHLYQIQLTEVWPPGYTRPIEIGNSYENAYHNFRTDMLEFRYRYEIADMGLPRQFSWSDVPAWAENHIPPKRSIRKKFASAIRKVAQRIDR